MNQEEFPYEIRMAYRSDWEDAMALAWKTFLQFEAEDYEPQGIANFENFITDNTLYRMFVMGAYQMFVALENNQVVGMITLRSNCHISLLFVEAACHKKGIGRALIDRLCCYLVTELATDRITVNASPFGVGFYHTIGFVDLGKEETKAGIRYTPMELILKK